MDFLSPIRFISHCNRGTLELFIKSSANWWNFQRDFRNDWFRCFYQKWLYQPPWNNYAMITAYTWQTMGTNMILFLVGLQNIPHEPIEASQIDGATGWQTYRYVTWPLLQPIATVVILMALINSFKVFDIIWVMTQGGPFRSSETLAVTMYRESFTMFQMGYGAAIAVVLTIFELFLSWIYLRKTFQREL